MHYINRMPSFLPVAAGSPAALQLPLGPTYHQIILRYKRSGVDATEAQCKSDLTEIRLKVNGRTLFQLSAKHTIDLLNKYYGVAFTPGQIVIPLARPWMRQLETEERLAWGTANLNSFSIETDIASSAVSPSLEAMADIDPMSRQDLGGIIEVHKQEFATPVSGIFEIRGLATLNGNLVALHCENSNITKLESYMNKQVAIDADLDVLKSLYTWNGERSPQAGYAHIDACYRNRIMDQWPLTGLQDFVVKPTLSAAGSIPIIMETYNVPFGLAT